ncbi:MFS transporter [Roseomonas marmotae]|uniref:MFS transporter n=1 Tax=Roseomonas marmotae TaxID=2768161 RepID=A0ABS3K9N4_9PROT|nr:MFS transporter [Roseomonas marmotae]MBO1073727.1 MFS transporter [Roseomonas marmotae]QTI78638.1 MFS transporter [Roseomonas marmotae]
MKGGRNLVAAAFALTALSYGLGRFAYGLLLPQIREDLALSSTAAGWIGGGAFATYCIGIVLASAAGSRLGERNMAMLAGLAATLGMGLVALASSVPVLAAAMALAGLSTGLTSPPLALAVARRFDEHNRAKANGMINAGTAAGIVLSGIAATAFTAAWRELYVLFALIGAAVTTWLRFALPAISSGQKVDEGASQHLARPGLVSLCAAASLMGASSTAVWTFGADLLRAELSLSEWHVAFAWIMLGFGGLVGSSTGILVKRFGIGPVHRLALLGMALCYGMLVVAASAPLLALAAMSLFGAAYIVSSGVLLIRGTFLLPDRPGLGLGIPFLAIAVGQAIGAPVFGAVLDSAGAGTALSMFAAMAFWAMIWGLEDVASPQECEEPNGSAP